MAKTVNVINDGELPVDVYETVIQDLRMQWIEKNPLAELNLTKEEIESIEQCVFRRSVAKKPVMTISYGASNRNMIRNLLTHKGEGSGILGEYIPLWNDENIKYTQDVPQNVIEQPLIDLGLGDLYSLEFKESKSRSIRGIRTDVEKVENSSKKRYWIYKINFI